MYFKQIKVKRGHSVSIIYISVKHLSKLEQLY